MTTRSLFHATLASTLLLLVAAAVQDTVGVAGSLLSMLVSGVWLAIRLDDTSKPVRLLLDEDGLAVDESRSS